MTILKGYVSKQQFSGETVTIDIKCLSCPGGESTMVVITGTDGGFSTYFQGVMGYNYSAIASIEEDEKYKAAQSKSVTFSEGKEDRTITLEAD